MTVPLGTDTPQKHAASSRYRDEQLEGRPTIPGEAGPPGPAGDVHWARLGTDGIGWENATGAENTVEWYAADFDGYDPPGDTETDFWKLEKDVGAGVFGDDVYHLFAKKGGIYTFTQQLLTSDLDATPPKAFEYQTRLQVLDLAFSFPGQIGTSSYLQDKEQLWIDDDGGDDLWLNRSWTIPVIHNDEGNPIEMGQMKLLHSNIDLFWSIRLWITRHGDRLDVT